MEETAMEGKQATPQTERHGQQTCRLEASLIFTRNAWEILQRLKERFRDRTHAHRIKRALALLSNVEPYAQGDVLYVVTRPLRKGEVEAGEVIQIKI